MGIEKKETGKTYKVRISEIAEQNIDEITGYIAYISHQPLNALRVGDALFETIERISKHPLAFRECIELPTKSKRYRRAICFSWAVIYRVTGAEILILGVIHTSRSAAAMQFLKKIK